MPFTFSGSSVDRLDRYFTVVFQAAAAADCVDTYAWMAPFHAQLRGVREVHSTAGSDAGTVTVIPRKISVDATAPGAAESAGTVDELITAAIDLKATADTVQTPTLEAADVCHFRPGDRLALNFAGTQTAVAGLLIVFVFERE